MQLGTYRSEFPSRSPDLGGRLKNPDELVLLNTTDGVEQLIPQGVQRSTGIPPLRSVTNPDPEGSNTHLWVITQQGTPVLPELAPSAAGLAAGRAKHTNLTGGADAHAGGELWFQSDDSFYFSGASGRYEPRNLAELDAIASVFTEAGYRVAHCGWDDVASRPRRSFRGQLPLI
jgi:hypothetical protein